MSTLSNDKKYNPDSDEEEEGEESDDNDDDSSDDDSFDGDRSSQSKKSKSSRNKLRNNNQPTNEQSPIYYKDNSSEYKRSNQFKGSVRIKPKVALKNAVLIKKREFSIPIPNLPLLTKQYLTIDLIEYIWQEFINHDTDESELILFHYVPTIIQNMNTEFEYEILIGDLSLKAIDDDDYIEFQELMKHLAEYFKSFHDNRLSCDTRAQQKSFPSTCCALEACCQGDLPSFNHHPEFEIQNPGDSECSVSNFGDNNSVQFSINSHSGFSACDSISKPGDGTSSIRKIFKNTSTKKEESNYSLLVTFTHFMATNNGVLRNKHILPIMDKLEIRYDEENLPGMFSTVYEDFLVPSFEAFVDIVNSLRIDGNFDVNDVENIDNDFYLPPWLNEQYGPLELMMFKQYFTSYSDEFIQNDNDNMDQDDIRNDFDDDESYYSKFSGINSPRGLCGNDEKEVFEFENDNFNIRKLRGIMKNMNANISELQARDILLSTCIKTINGKLQIILNYENFVRILFKVSQGKLMNKSISIALKVLNTNLIIFKEINDIKIMPSKYFKLDYFGGSPIVCKFTLFGPHNTPYEDGGFKFEITIKEGHPYVCPHVVFISRIMSINVLNKLDGAGQVPHLVDTWQPSWTLRDLLEHILKLFTEPNLSFISNDYLQVAIAWSYAKFLNDKNENEKNEIDYNEECKKTGDVNAIVDNGVTCQLNVIEEEKENEGRDIIEYLKDIIPSNLNINWNILRQTNLDGVEEHMRGYNKIEQIYLNSLCLYLYDYDLYIETVKKMVQFYSLPIEYYEDNYIENNLNTNTDNTDLNSNFSIPIIVDCDNSIMAESMITYEKNSEEK